MFNKHFVGTPNVCLVKFLFPQGWDGPLWLHLFMVREESLGSRYPKNMGKLYPKEKTREYPSLMILLASLTWYLSFRLGWNCLKLVGVDESCLCLSNKRMELEGPRCIGIGRGVEGWAGEEKSWNDNSGDQAPLLERDDRNTMSWNYMHMYMYICMYI